jgi:hypothetical protein
MAEGHFTIGVNAARALGRDISRVSLGRWTVGLDRTGSRRSFAQGFF